MDLTEKTDNTYRHPWEMSRRKNILALLPHNSGAVYADIGAGDQYVTARLRTLTTGRVFAVDTGYPDVIAESDGIISLNDAARLDDQSIDCIIMMDVLEHIEDERRFLHTVLGKLRPQGTVIITVPAMQFLFSAHDEFLHHVRRYSRARLLAVLRESGIRIDECHYFYSSLFLLRCVSVALEKSFPGADRKNEGIGRWTFPDTGIVTRSLAAILDIDFFMSRVLHRLSVRIPGLSLLAVGRKMP